MIHVKRTTTAGFTQVANTVLRDGRLSLKAKGLLVQLLSHEDGWQQSIAFCVRECSDGREAVASGLRELEDTGYLTRTKRRGGSGRWVWDHIVTDSPLTGNPSTENPSIDKEALGEETQVQEQDQPLALRAKARNPEIDALAEIEGLNLTELGKGTGARLGAALSEIRGKSPNVDASEILQRAGNYATHFPDATLTAKAVAKWWERLGAPAVSRNGKPSVAAELAQEALDLERRGL